MGITESRPLADDQDDDDSEHATEIDQLPEKIIPDLTSFKRFNTDHDLILELELEDDEDEKADSFRSHFISPQIDVILEDASIEKTVSSESLNVSVEEKELETSIQSEDRIVAGCHDTITSSEDVQVFARRSMKRTFFKDDQKDIVESHDQAKINIEHKNDDVQKNVNHIKHKLPQPSKDTRLATLSFISRRCVPKAPTPIIDNQHQDQVSHETIAPSIDSDDSNNTCRPESSSKMISDNESQLDAIFFGAAERKGNRPYMEDRCIFLSDFFGHSSWWGAVFDGHGGNQAAVWLSENLHKKVLLKLSKANEDYDISQELHSAFIETDEALLSAIDGSDAGSTVTCVLKFNRQLFCANTGDSRSIICLGSRSSEKWQVRATALSTDHRPSNQDEKARIVQRGGYVVNDRLMGQLAVSRSFGDRPLKRSAQELMGDESDDDETLAKETHLPLLIADPDISCFDLDSEDGMDALFVLLACDGLYDVMTNQDACEFLVNELEANGGNCTTAADALANHAVEDLGSSDNVTCLVVLLKPWRVSDGEALGNTPGETEVADSLFSHVIERVKTGAADSETPELQISDHVRSAIKNVLCFDNVKDISIKGTGACCRAIANLKIQQARQIGNQREQHGGKVVASASISLLLVPQLAVIILQAYFRGVSTRRYIANFPSARSYQYNPKSTLLSILVRKLERRMRELETKLRSGSTVSPSIVMHLRTQISSFKSLNEGREFDSKKCAELARSIELQIQQASLLIQKRDRSWLMRQIDNLNIDWPEIGLSTEAKRSEKNEAGEYWVPKV